jgi:hypothetical protein
LLAIFFLGLEGFLLLCLRWEMEKWKRVGNRKGWGRNGGEGREK